VVTVLAVAGRPQANLSNFATKFACEIRGMAALHALPNSESRSHVPKVVLIPRMEEGARQAPSPKVNPDLAADRLSLPARAPYGASGDSV
jgi:hypothetical protein